MAAHVIPTGERLVSIEEYLRSAYEPDVDFVDGALEERNVGEYEHGKVQLMLGRILAEREDDWGIDVVVECRVQVAADRFRIPDVTVLRRGRPVSRIVREAPLICIEVLSPEDTWTRTRLKLEDYLRMGVEHIWVFDPEAREAHRFDGGGFHKVTGPEIAVEGTAIRVALADVFAVLPAPSV